MRRSFNPSLLPVVFILPALFSWSCDGRSGKTSAASAATKKWEFSTGRPRSASHGTLNSQQIPAIGPDGTIYAPGDRGLYALRPDGTQKWFFPNMYQEASVPLHFAMVDDSGNVWFDFAFYTTRLSGGAEPVSAEGEPVKSGVSQALVSQIAEARDGTVFVAMDGGGALLPPEARGGLAEWKPAGAFFSFGNDGTIYASTRAGLVAYASDHNVAWTVETTSGGEPAISADGTIYLGGYQAVTAVDATGKEGKIKWKFPLPRQLFTTPAIGADGTVYVGCSDGKIYAFGLDGTLQWNFSTGNEVLATPTVAKSGTVYVGGTDHYLYAIDPKGKLKWKFKTEGEVFTPTIGENGTIYFQSGEGKIFAVDDSEPAGGLGGQWPKRGADARNTARAPLPTTASER